MIKSIKPLSIGWGAVLMFLLGYIIFALSSQGRVQFDLLALLPESQNELNQEISQVMKETDFGNKVVLLVGHSDPEKAHDAFLKLRELVVEGEFPFQEDIEKPESYKQLFKELYPYRASLLSREDEDYLLKGENDLLFKRALSEITSPFMGSSNLKEDPFGFFLHFVMERSFQPSIQMGEDSSPYVDAEGKRWYIFRGHTPQSAFSLKSAQSEGVMTLDALKPLFLQDVVLLKNGAFFYAMAGAEQAKGDINLIGGLSLVFVVGLLFLVFRTFRPLFFATLTIASGLIGGLAVALFTFGSIHILSLVFGLSLVGIAVDYAIHYFCASYTPHLKDPITLLKGLFPALPMGMISSSLGYLLLIIVPFPGVQQMALLTAVGLVFAFITVCLWGQYFILSEKSKKISPVYKLQKWIERGLSSLNVRIYRVIASLALVAVFLGGSFSLTFEDNVKTFQSLDSELQAEERQISTLIGLEGAPSFFSISAPTLDERLTIEEILITRLDRLKEAGVIKGYRGLSTLFPSRKRQCENKALLNAFYQDQMVRLFTTLNLTAPTSFSAYGMSAGPLVFTGQFQSILPKSWTDLYSSHRNRLYIYGAQSLQQLQDVARNEPGVLFINVAEIYSQIFKEYRQFMAFMIIAVLSFIGIILAFKFKLRGVIIILTPVVLSVLGTIGILSLFKIPLTLFHEIGLLLTVCIGVDYALFLYCREKNKESLVLLANGMAALTTLMSFGLLSISQTHAVQNFGIAVFSGITLCFVMTTLLIKGRTYE